MSTKKTQVRRNTVDVVDKVMDVFFDLQMNRTNKVINVLAEKFGFSIQDANNALIEKDAQLLTKEFFARKLTTYDGIVTENGMPLTDGKGLLMQASKWKKMVKVGKVTTGNVSTGSNKCSYICNAGTPRQHQCGSSKTKFPTGEDDPDRCVRHQEVFLIRKEEREQIEINIKQQQLTPPTSPNKDVKNETNIPNIQLNRIIDVVPDDLE